MAIMESPSPLSERWEPAMSNNILNPLEKELLIRLYRSNPDIKLSDFCRANNVSEAAFKTWLKKYGAEGLSGLYRSKKTPSLLPEGVDDEPLSPGPSCRERQHREDAASSACAHRDSAGTP